MHPVMNSKGAYKCVLVACCDCPRIPATNATFCCIGGCTNSVLDSMCDLCNYTGIWCLRAKVSCVAAVLGRCSTEAMQALAEALTMSDPGVLQLMSVQP